jgi:hypothetical protein
MSMAQPWREDALAVLEQGQNDMRSLLARLSEPQLTDPATIGGGDWSAKDLIGHIAFWEEIALVTLEAWLRGERPPIAETFTPGNTDQLNAWNQERKRAWLLERVRSDSEATHRRLISEIERMSDRDWALHRPFDGDEPEDLGTELGGVLGAPGKPFGHAFAHLPDLSAYVEQVAS